MFKKKETFQTSCELPQKKLNVQTEPKNCHLRQPNMSLGLRTQTFRWNPYENIPDISIFELRVSSGLNDGRAIRD